MVHSPLRQYFSLLLTERGRGAPAPEALFYYVVYQNPPRLSIVFFIAIRERLENRHKTEKNNTFQAVKIPKQEASFSALCCIFKQNFVQYDG